MLKHVLFWPGLALLIVAICVVLWPDRDRQALRSADRLWQAGRVSEARQNYLALQRVQSSPTISLRLALIHLRRDECAAAYADVARALAPSHRLSRDEAALAHLVAGQCATFAGNASYAQAEWSAIDPRSPLRAMASILSGEAALKAGRSREALQHFAAAAAAHPAEPWRSTAYLRLALLAAAADPATATRRLQQIPATLPDASADLAAFAPIAATVLPAEAGRLGQIVARPPAERHQLLGQYLLDLQLYRLAVSQFEAVPADDTGAIVARAHAAYARWLLGERDVAAQQLAELHSFDPRHPFVAALYATILLEIDGPDAAENVLAPAVLAAPRDPALLLARSDILATRRAYAAAIAERQRAFELAAPDARGRYALALAELHIDLAYHICDSGVAAARSGTEAAPELTAAWRMLAEMLYHCRQYEATTAAAREGLRRASDDPACLFLLGAALWEAGRPSEGRPHLLRASDLDGSGAWRRRAEALMASG